VSNQHAATRWPAQPRQLPPFPISFVLAAAALITFTNSSFAVQRPRVPVSQMAGPRELLELYGIGESQLDSFFDHETFSDATDEVLAKILNRIGDIGRHKMKAWAAESPPLTTIQDAPAAQRGHIFHLAGTVVEIEKHDLPPEMAQVFDFRTYFVVHMDIPDTPYQALICTRQIPLSWQAQPGSPHRAVAKGIFLHIAETSASQTELVFAAPRIEWFPRSNENNVSPELKLLGSLGVDIGQLERARKSNRRPIGQLDRHFFYQLLLASTQLDTRQKLDLVKPFDLETLLRTPETVQGHLMTIEGTAKQLTRVAVEEADIVEGYEIDHYYQIDLFVPLGDQTVHFGDRETQEGPEFVNHYPITICTLTIPDELQAEADRLAEAGSERGLLNVRLRTTGFLLKLWSYKTQYASSFGDQQRQLSPMFITVEPSLVKSRPQRNTGVIGGILFALAVAVVWLLVWRTMRTDRRHGAQATSDQTTPPDFSGLE